MNASDGAHGTARLAAETRSGDVVVGVVSDAGVDPRRAGRLRDTIGALLREGALPVATSSSDAAPDASTSSAADRVPPTS